MKIFLLVMFCVMTLAGCGGSSSSPVEPADDSPAIEIPAAETEPSDDIAPEIDNPATDYEQSEDITPNTDNPVDPELSEDKASNFDLAGGVVTLNNGIEMPILGIGTYSLSSSQAENSVYWALKARNQ